MPKPARVYRKRYVIEMTVKEFERVLAHDRNVTEKDETLYGQLRRQTAAYDVDYDAHFGPQVSFDLDVNDDTPVVHLAIFEIVSHLCKRRATKKGAGHAA